MGLHPDVKKYLKSRFSTAVSQAVPPGKCEIQICDLMWLLFKFHPDETSSGEDLVNFFWRPIERFFDAGGVTFVCVFDAPAHVPVAKAEEHRRRYGKTVQEPLQVHTCDAVTLPSPWHAALANRNARATLCAYIADGLGRRFQNNKRKLVGRTLFVSGVGTAVSRVDETGTNRTEEHAAAAAIGEGDLAVAYWTQHFHERSVIVRVLDSDQIPILQLRANIARRREPLFIWLVSPKRDDALPYHGYASMPHEAHTLVDVLALNLQVAKAGVRVEEFCFQLICQKTDFVDKVIANLGVAPSLAALEKNVSNAITVTASTARCDPELVKRSFARAAIQSKRKRAEVRRDGDVEFRRAWWTLCYWAFAWAGPLPDQLKPRPAFGFDENGARTARAENEPYPDVMSFLNESLK